MAIESAPSAASHEPPSNLPVQVTSFIGRERELAEVARLLSTTRLLTLTGAGGSGKTRLALRLAEDLRHTYPDGVWLVELAALTDPALVPRMAASVLGVRETPGATIPASLARFLHDKRLLLVLDNCEHVIDAVARLVQALLRECPALTVIATSREPLNCAGETSWPVPSLAVPPERTGARPSPEHLIGYEAVRLFIDRARAVQPGFAVTERNAAALAEICQRLDGIPLAIELAAARMRVFSVEQIAARLDDRFTLLTAGQRTAMPRHQTLRAAIDWSYNLLAEPARALLRRLSVFAGGWSFEAAEAVGAGDGIQRHAVLDLLAQLVEKSLVISEEQRGAVRYRMLETIRQYAREKLDAAGETEHTRDRHLAYFLALAEEIEPKLRGPEQLASLVVLEAEHDNLRAALEWSLHAGGDAALRLSGALAWFWWLDNSFVEGRGWLERALAASSERSAARMKALYGAGWLAHHQRDLATAENVLTESLAIARELDDRWSIAWVLHHLGRVAYFRRDPERARLFGEDCLAIAEQVGDPLLVAWALHLLGLAAHIAADYPAARAYYERSLAIRRQAGYQEGVVILLSLLGISAFREREYSRAQAFFHQMLAEMGEERIGGPWSMAQPLAAFAALAARHGQPERAVRLAGAALELCERYNMPLIPLMEGVMVESLVEVRRTLDEDAYAAAWAQGRAMTRDERMAEALAVEVVPPSAASVPEVPMQPAPFGNLTVTEAQVLRLLAMGHTTKEIAAELVVAISTVDRHLTHIYQKLGVRNRAEAIAFALTHGLA